jgi:hypothetical protein
MDCVLNESTFYAICAFQADVSETANQPERFGKDPSPSETGAYPVSHMCIPVFMVDVVDFYYSTKIALVVNLTSSPL